MNVHAEVTFIDPSVGKPRFIMQPYGKPAEREGRFERKEILIEDARGLSPCPSLDLSGFQLVTSQTHMPQNIADVDVSSKGYLEIELLLREVTGAKDVHIFDHTIRSSAPDNKARGTARHAHNDYSQRSIEWKLKELGVDPGSRRFCQINAWRPLVEPVLVSPLAVADGQTVEANDLISCDLVYPDRIGEIFQIAHNPNQRWYYHPKMTPNEVLLIKGFDSEIDARVRFCPHSAFSHPDERPDDPPRRSVEFRTIVVF